MLADQVDHVVGVDTHRDEHALGVVARDWGGCGATGCRGSRLAGYREAFTVRG